MEQALIKCDSSHIPDAAADSIYRLGDAFIAAQDIAQSSRLTYRRALKVFFVWLTGRNDMWTAGQVTRFDILAYKDMLGRTKRVATANMYLFIVTRFFAWLATHGIHPDVAGDVKRFKRTPGHAKDWRLPLSRSGPYWPASTEPPTWACVISRS